MSDTKLNENASLVPPAKRGIRDTVTDKVYNAKPAMTLLVTAILSLLFTLDHYYTLMPLFGAPAKDTINSSLFQIPARSNNFAGLYTFAGVGTAPTTSSVLNAVSGIFLVIGLFLTIFGTSTIAAMAVKDQLESLVVGVAVSAILGYVYGVFTKVAVDGSFTWFVVWTIIFVVAVVAIAGYSVWRFMKLGKDTETAALAASRKWLFWVPLVLLVIGAIMVIVEHIYMGNATKTYGV